LQAELLTSNLDIYAALCNRLNNNARPGLKAQGYTCEAAEGG